MIILIGFIVIGCFSPISIPDTQPNGKSSNLTIPSQVDEPIVINGNTELAQRSSGGTGTRADPYVIGGLVIKGTFGSCITIRYTTSFFVIMASVFSSDTQEDPVISFNSVLNGAIEDCYITGGSSGVGFEFCTNCTIRESSCTVGYNGINIYNSNNCTVIGCYAHSNNVGLAVRGNNSLIVNNSIYKNRERGLIISHSSQNTRFYQNKIGWNPVNAYSDSNSTEFTNSIDMGNAWLDYNGTGAYEIAGSGSEVDTLPTLLQDNNDPIIDSPPDKAFDIESGGETVIWIASDDFPYAYSLSINGISQGILSWDGRPITISLDGFPEGTYSLVMEVTDAAQNYASDEVIATAVSIMLGGIGTELVIWASVLSVVVFLVVIVIIKKVA